MKKHALLIGINEYSDFKHLTGAAQDATKVAETLQKLYGFDGNELTLLTCRRQGDYRPSRNTIREHIRRIEKDCELLLIGFWGHGKVLISPNGDHDLYLCALDTYKSDLEESGIPLSFLKNHLKSVRIADTCIILDCCQKIAGTRGDESTLTQEAYDQIDQFYTRDVTAVPKSTDDVRRNPTRAIWNSCSLAQEALEWKYRSEHEHGIFTVHLLEAMQRSNRLADWVTYVSDKVPKTVMNQWGQPQTPFIKTEGGNDIQFPTTGTLSLSPATQRKNAGKTRPKQKEHTKESGEKDLCASGGKMAVAPEVIPRMKRGQQALEDSDWSKASEYFNWVLDNIDAEHAPAFTGLLCAELEVQKEELLGDYKTLFSEFNNFKKAVRFAGAEYKKTLEGYDHQVKKRIQQERREAQKAASQRARDERAQRETGTLAGYYRQNVEKMKTASTAEDWRQLEGAFRTIRPYRDTVELEGECGRKARTIAEKMERERARKAGTEMVLTIKRVKYPFRWCPPGTFDMGSPASEEGRHAGETQHRVTLSRGFWMLKTPVTQGMWEGVMVNNPSNWKGTKLPVEQVSWEDCQGFIQKLNGHGVAPDGYRFSLPTEAQWEYACRSGTPTPFYFGSVWNWDKANCDGKHPYGTNTNGKYHRKTVDVGLYPANAWGLYDMHGNVWEWCEDWYGNYPSGAVTDPVGSSSGLGYVLRGGSWENRAQECRSASRSNFHPSLRGNSVGLRLSLVRAE